MHSQTAVWSWAVSERVLKQLGKPALAFVIALGVLLVLRRLLIGWCERRTTGPRSLAAAVLDTVRFPSLLWCVVASLAVALRFPELTRSQESRAALWIVILLILSFSLAAAAMVVRMIALYGERQRMPFAVVGLSRTLTYIVVLAIGAMILLRYLNIPITPLLTAFGVGGLAVALALQDSLANFFAGIHILVETPIRVGDWIQLASGDEGTVTDIGWRTTRVLTGTQNVIVIPNSRITSSILVNCSLPTRVMAVPIVILAGRKADPRRVMRLAFDEASRVDKVLPEPAPQVFLDPGLTPSHLGCRLLVFIADRQDQLPVQSEVRLRVIERLRAEGVPMEMALEGFPSGA